jgi:hypothetical protein
MLSIPDTILEIISSWLFKAVVKLKVEVIVTSNAPFNLKALHLDAACYLILR